MREIEGDDRTNINSNLDLVCMSVQGPSKHFHCTVANIDKGYCIDFEVVLQNQYSLLTSKLCHGLVIAKTEGPYYTGPLLRVFHIIIVLTVPTVMIRA